MIVDAHAHVVPRVQGQIGAGATRGTGYGRAAVGEEEIQLMPPCGEHTVFEVETLVANMDWAGVDRVVLLQGPFYGECNTYVAKAVARFPDRFWGAAYLDPWRAGSREGFDSLVGAGFRILKLECSVRTGFCGLYPEARLDSDELAWLWTELERREMVLVLDLGRPGDASYQTGPVGRIAAAHPQLHIVIAHLGQPNPVVDRNQRRSRQWFEQLDLGRLPNVYFDMAALPAYSEDEVFPFPSAERHLRLALERIGPAKVMWGTDVPGLLKSSNYPQLLRLAELHTQFLTVGERALVLGENALKVYGGTG